MIHRRQLIFIVLQNYGNHKTTAGYSGGFAVLGFIF
jgi:hypothetical protein